MNHLEEYHETTKRTPAPTFSTQQQIISSLLLLIFGYYATSYFEIWPGAVNHALHELFVRAIPSRFIYLVQQLMIRTGYMTAQEGVFSKEDFGNLARKKDAIGRLMGSPGIPIVLKKARSLSNYSKLLPSVSANGPPGLGNWDNSCYQNSVLQGLASLPAFQQYIQRSLLLCQKSNVKDDTTQALATLLDQLADTSRSNSTLWTPAALKSMDSWQQQDAQEYFQRIADAVEKEALQHVKTMLRDLRPGLPLLSTPQSESVERIGLRERVTDSTLPFLSNVIGNPMDGLQAQALECQTCGFSEGVSFTQFNCLTLSLGIQGSCHLEHLLDAYTEPELIEGVECDQCTKIASEQEKDTELDEPSNPVPSQDGRKKLKVLRTKAKQLTLGRLPRNLIFHINRSIFDEYGNQRKNASFVQFDSSLDILGKWCPPIDADVDKVQATYLLKCIITHSGRHDNGHYVAYGKRDKDWYCFNDEIVTKFSEEEVLTRGNVFMLFFEMSDQIGSQFTDAPESAQSDATTASSLDGSVSTAATSEDDVLENTSEPIASPSSSAMQAAKTELAGAEHADHAEHLTASAISTV